MTRPISARLASGLARFLYVLAWPAGLYYAFLLGGSFLSCLKEGADPFSWAMSGLVLAALLLAPVTLLMMLVVWVIAMRMKPESGRWRHRFAWLGGAAALVMLAGLMTGSADGRCHLDFMG